MGGDHGLDVALPAAATMLTGDAGAQLYLVGDRGLIGSAMGGRFAGPSAELSTGQPTGQRWRIEHAPDVVAMSDRPSRALRHKTGSSMYRALQLLAAGEVDAVVSAGNTGALMAMGYTLVGTLQGIDRPAICSPLPSRTRSAYLLDLGANVDCRAKHLHQFATMGSALASGVDGIAMPRVALLNVGRESSKGSEQVRLAAELIEADPQLNYSGFIEGDALFSGAADVVVCDGFAGNVALKVCEGTASLIADKLREALTASWQIRLLAGLAQRWLRPLYRDLDPQAYNGAVLLGLRGVVVKSHGGASAQGFHRALQRAAAAVRSDVVGLTQQRLSAPAVAP